MRTVNAGIVYTLSVTKTISTIISVLYLAPYTSHGLGYKQNRLQLTTTITSYIFCHLESNN